MRKEKKYDPDGNGEGNETQTTAEEKPGEETPVNTSSEETPVDGPSNDSSEVTSEEKAKVDLLVKTIISELKSSREKATIVKEKQEVLSRSYSGARIKEEKIKFYTDRKGQTHFMNKSDMLVTSEWFKSLLYQDHAKMRKLYEQMETKLGDVLVEGTNARGGFLIPTLLWEQIVPILEDAAVIRSNAFVIDMSGMKTSTLNIDSIATRPLVTWTGENVSKSSSSMTFAQASLTPYKLAAFVTLSTELLEDSPFNLVQMVTQQFGNAIAAEEDRAFMTGSGTGRPTGLNTYTYRGLDAGGSLTVDELNRLYWLLPQQHRSKAFWIMNSRTLSAAYGLQDSQNRPIFPTVQEGEFPKLWGRPVLEQNDYESSSILLIDLLYYYVAHKGPFTVALATEAYLSGVSLFQNNLVAIRVEERIDGELISTRAGVEMTNTGIS